MLMLFFILFYVTHLLPCVSDAHSVQLLVHAASAHHVHLLIEPQALQVLRQHEG